MSVDFATLLFHQDCKYCNFHPQTLESYLVLPLPGLSVPFYPPPLNPTLRISQNKQRLFNKNSHSYCHHSCSFSNSVEYLDKWRSDQGVRDISKIRATYKYSINQSNIYYRLCYEYSAGKLNHKISYSLQIP